MRKNGVLEPQALYDLIYGGRGKMPGYGKDCTPKVGFAMSSGGAEFITCTQGSVSKSQTKPTVERSKCGCRVSDDCRESALSPSA